MVKAKIITVLFSLVFSISSFAVTIQYDGPWMWNDINVKTTTSIGGGDVPTSYVTSKGTIAIRGYKNQVTSLEIPKKIEWVAEEWGENFLEYGDRVLLARVEYDLDVVAIADNAFNGSNHSRYQKLEAVTIPNTVTKIGEGSFYYCSNLRSMVIPNSVTEIGRECFYACVALTSVTLPNQIAAIPSRCFAYCTSLSNTTIPNSVKEVGGEAFYESAIPSVYLGTNCTAIGFYAFAGCPNLKSVTIENVSQIDRYQFDSCKNIEELTFGDGVRDIGEYAFSDSSASSANTHLRVLKFGNNVENIGEHAFGYCGSDPSASYMNVVIPPSVKSIGYWAFAYMYNVTNLVIQGVQKVNFYQFMEMTNLVSLAFGPDVQEIEDGFQMSYFYNLKRVCFESNDMKRIGNGAFKSSSSSGDYHCKKLEEVILPPSLESIGDCAFEYCSALKDVHVRGSSYTIPKSVKDIGSDVFYSCASITNVVLEPGLTVLGQSMFSRCTGIKEIVIPESIETIGDSAFSSCSSLSRIELEEGLQILGEYMFSSTAISEIFVPKSITQMGGSCFSGCKNLKDIFLEEGLPLVGASMFNACTLLQKVSIPSSVKQIGPNAYSGCTGLTTVNLSEGLDFIDQSAFKGCVGLRAMSFPESLNAIGNSAFSGCTSLSTISFPSGVSEVGVGAFSGCSVKSMLFNNANGEFLDQFSKESLRTLFLGKSADGITGGLLSDCSALETIMTAAANRNYSVDDCGVLFDKGKTKLIKYPCAASHQSYTAPETVKSVDDGAFAFASALQDIDFPASLTTVGESAFDWCLGLGSVSFPATLRTIGTGAFTTCPSLEDLYFEGNAPTIGDNQFWYSSPVFHVQENTTGWDAVAERFDVEVVIGEGSGGEDSPVLTMDWLAQYPTLWSAAGGDLATAAKMTAANGLTLEECYIAGLDPTDPDSKFEARIDIVNGQPVVTWKPQLDKADAALRTYTTYGCSEPGGDWVDFDSATPEIKATLRFFKVCVDMK